MNPVRQILEATQAIGDEFFCDEERVFIRLREHAGGTWKLQLKDPDGTWGDIADDSGGVSFESDGLVLFYAQSFLPYRLNGGDVGAKAWRISGKLNPGFDADADLAG